MRSVSVVALSLFQNSKMLMHVPGKTEIRTNVLVIKSLAQSDEGMYQCAATNAYGTSMTSAQLRVLCTF